MEKTYSFVPFLSMCFLPTAAVIGAASAALYIGAPLDLIILFTWWAIVFDIYGLNRFTDIEDMLNNPEKRMFYQNRPYLLHIIILSLVLSVFALIITHRFTLIHLLILVGGLSYSLKIVPVIQNNLSIRFIRLKELPFIKSLTVALIWGNAFFTINLLLYPELSCKLFDIIMLVISFTIVTFVNTNFLDIPDMIGDRATGVQTIPARYGIKNTLIYAITIPTIVWLFAILFLYAQGYIGDLLTLFLLINVLYPVFYIGGYFMKLFPGKVMDLIADSCAFVFSIGLLGLYILREYFSIV